MRKKFIFYCPSQEKLAKDFGGKDSIFELGTISWKDFPDGFPNVMIFNSKQLVNGDVIFLADFSCPKEIFRQLAVMYALPSYGIHSLKVILPFFPTGTMDRASHYGEIVTAKTLARMLSVIPMAECPTQIYIFDIHAQQEQFYFADTVRVRCMSAMNLLLNKLSCDENTAVAFPDEGAYKRFGKYFSRYNKIICEKRRRENGERVITIKEGNPHGKRIFIVDDLIMSGGTILECAKVLDDLGAIKVSAYATHGVFPDKSWTKFVDANIDLYITNSCPESISKIDKVFIDSGEITIFSLSSEIASATINYY
ncbi:MAG: ribose-phosphate diphosphokinase [Patescibacteria group bacterium]